MNTQEYIVTARGSKIYNDPNRHEFAIIPATYHILSVGMHKESIPLITTIENGNLKVYKLPQGLQGWVRDCISLSLGGLNVFPADVEFGVEGQRLYAEML